MKQINVKVKYTETLKRKLLFYFRETEYVFYFNSNSVQKKDIIAVSNESTLSDNEWKIGFFAYDFKNNIENLTSNGIDGIGFPDTFFFSPELLFEFLIDEVCVSINSSKFSVDKIQLLLEQLDVKEAFEYSEIHIKSTPRISKEEYLSRVLKLKEHIQQGDIYEINYCQEFFAENVELNPVETYFKLNKKSPTPFSCFVKFQDKYLLCASPERYINKKGSQLISQPIKGTIKRGNSDAEDEQLKYQLLHDKKERSENIMIVDLVRNDLSKIAQLNTVKVDELCGIYTFSQVHQMISTISAEIKEDKNFEDIIYATFPMGSMTGAPKIKAMELIEQYETTKRGLFSGTVGSISPNGDFDFNVVIRSILYNESSKKLSYFVGSAITNLSSPEYEYNECLLKAKAINEVLNSHD